MIQHLLKMPIFPAVGAGNQGTSPLHDYLDQHLKIYLCPEKESNIFALKNHMVTDFILPECQDHF